MEPGKFISINTDQSVNPSDFFSSRKEFSSNSTWSLVVHLLLRWAIIRLFAVQVAVLFYHGNVLTQERTREGRMQMVSHIFFIV